MTLSADEFMPRFLLHALPAGFQRICHYSLLANGHRQENLAKVRALFNPQNALIVTPTDKTQVPLDPLAPKFVCANCGAQMRVIDIFLHGQAIRAPPHKQCAPMIANTLQLSKRYLRCHWLEPMGGSLALW